MIGVIGEGHPGLSEVRVLFWPDNFLEARWLCFLFQCFTIMTKIEAEMIGSVSIRRCSAVQTRTKILVKRDNSTISQGNLNVHGDIYGRGSKCYHLSLGAQRKDLY